MMAQVTMELRNVLKHEDFGLFDFEYKCDDLNWKQELEKRIIARFFFDEIGLESIDRFKHEFQYKMQSIMPYYNDLYNTTLFDGDPLTTQKLTEVLENIQDTTGSNTEDLTSNTNESLVTDLDETNTGTQGTITTDQNTTKASDYPQTLNLENDVLSGQQQSEGTNDQNVTNDFSSTRDQTDTREGSRTDNTTRSTQENLRQDQQKIIEGFQGIPYPELLRMHRDSILRINSMIIKELKTLFILVY